jgi:hypothetical protein
VHNFVWSTCDIATRQVLAAHAATCQNPVCVVRFLLPMDSPRCKACVPASPKLHLFLGGPMVSKPPIASDCWMVVLAWRMMRKLKVADTSLGDLERFSVACLYGQKMQVPVWSAQRQKCSRRKPWDVCCRSGTPQSRRVTTLCAISCFFPTKLRCLWAIVVLLCVSYFGRKRQKGRNHQEARRQPKKLDACASVAHVSQGTGTTDGVWRG